MNKKKLLSMLIIRTFAVSLIFYGAVLFENAKSHRLIILLLLFSIYILVGFSRLFLINKAKLIYLSFIIDIIVIFFLEYNSRFLMNYFFHSFYIISLLEVSIYFERKKGLLIGIGTAGVSLVKYWTLISYKTDISSISQMVFFTIINIFLLVIINLAHYYREEKEKKEELYTELLNAHKKLKEYSVRIQELAVVEERSRIARDIHDTLGHSLTAVIMELEMVDHLMESDIKGARSLLDNAKKSSRNSLISVREVVETLRIDDKISKGIDSIKELIDEFSQKTGLDIDFNIEGQVTKSNPIINVTLYRIVQEALTNAVRHGKATNVDVKIKYNSNDISFNIVDNGEGSKDIVEGMGLRGMRERILKLSGNLEIFSAKGFSVRGFIPLEVRKND